MNYARMKEFAPAITRIAIALVFLWFSLNQFFLTNDFLNLIPNFLVALFGVSPAVFVILNACLEFIFGLFLLFGMHVRLSSLILGIHLLGIAFSMGYGAIMARDLALALVTLSILFNGRDILCMQK